MAAAVWRVERRRSFFLSAGDRLYVRGSHLASNSSISIWFGVNTFYLGGVSLIQYYVLYFCSKVQASPLELLWIWSHRKPLYVSYTRNKMKTWCKRFAGGAEIIHVPEERKQHSTLVLLVLHFVALPRRVLLVCQDAWKTAGKFIFNADLECLKMTSSCSRRDPGAEMEFNVQD